MKHIILPLVASALLFTSCEKTVDLKYKGNTSGIVIEANITQEPGPYFVKITNSVALKDTGVYPTIDDAVVKLSDNTGQQETLVAEGHGLYRSATLQGTPGRSYTLNILAGGQTYTAQSTLPALVALDSIKIEEVKFAGEAEYYIIPVYRDPANKGNSYRFVLSINGKLVNQHLIQLDDVRNGLVNNQRLEINDDDLKLKKGDVVAVTMQCVDQSAALYYSTLALMNDSGPGGGTTPNNPPTNVTNGALGIFSAHTTQTRSITIQ